MSILEPTRRLGPAWISPEASVKPDVNGNRIAANCNGQRGANLENRIALQPCAKRLAEKHRQSVRGWRLLPCSKANPTRTQVNAVDRDLSVLIHGNRCSVPYRVFGRAASSTLGYLHLRGPCPGGFNHCVGELAKSSPKLIVTQNNLSVNQSRNRPRRCLLHSRQQSADRCQLIQFIPPFIPGISERLAENRCDGTSRCDPCPMLCDAFLLCT